MFMIMTNWVAAAQINSSETPERDIDLLYMREKKNSIGSVAAVWCAVQSGVVSVHSVHQNNFHLHFWLTCVRREDWCNEKAARFGSKCWFCKLFWKLFFFFWFLTNYYWLLTQYVAIVEIINYLKRNAGSFMQFLNWLQLFRGRTLSFGLKS